MNKLQHYIEERSSRDPEFKLAYEAEMLVLDLLNARKAKGYSQTDMALRLHVSQPYLAQIEGISKKINTDLMIRYASELGLSLKFVEL